MSLDADKLSRIAALRPNSLSIRRTPDAAGTSNWERLIQLLDGEVRSNRFGSHTYVQRRFADPCAGTADLRVLQLIAPDAALAPAFLAVA